MENRRKHSRIKFEAHCLLKGNAGDTYEVLLDDISLSGASLEVNVKTDFQIGDECELVLSEKSEAFPVKHTSKIVRVDSGIIAVDFLT
jgi:c-di-GMP-binding flagellar brake protein YcgR